MNFKNIVLSFGLCGAFGLQAFEYQPQEWDGSYDVTLNTLASWIAKVDKSHIDKLESWDNPQGYEVLEMLAQDSFAITSQEALDALRSDCTNAYLLRAESAMKHVLQWSLKDFVKDVKKVDKDELDQFYGGRFPGIDQIKILPSIYYLLEDLDLYDYARDTARIDNLLVAKARASGLYESSDIQAACTRYKESVTMLEQLGEQEYYDLTDFQDFFILQMLYELIYIIGMDYRLTQYRSWAYNFQKIYEETVYWY